MSENDYAVAHHGAPYRSFEVHHQIVGGLSAGVASVGPHVEIGVVRPVRIDRHKPHPGTASRTCGRLWARLSARPLDLSQTGHGYLHALVKGAAWPNLHVRAVQN
jgi:hypothetical protein